MQPRMCPRNFPSASHPGTPSTRVQVLEKWRVQSSTEEYRVVQTSTEEYRVIQCSEEEYRVVLRITKKFGVKMTFKRPDFAGRSC